MCVALAMIENALVPTEAQKLLASLLFFLAVQQEFASFERTSRGCGPVRLFIQDVGFQPEWVDQVLRTALLSHIGRDLRQGIV